MSERSTSELRPAPCTNKDNEEREPKRNLVDETVLYLLAPN